MTSISEQEQPTTATVEAQAAPKKARSAPRKAHIASAKAKSGKKATAARKAAKGAKAAKPAKTEAGARKGSKTEKVLDLLKRPDGASLKELMKATGWQAHSVRGFISGTLGKKMGLTVASAKGDGGERTYSVKG